MGGYDGYLTFDTSLNTKSFDAQIEELESKLATLEKAWETTNQMPAFEGKNEDLQKIGLNIEKVSNKLVELRKKQDDINNKGYKELQDLMDDIGGKTTGILKKVAKWGLAVFSVRSAYSLVRNAMSTISQYDEQLAKNIEYIRYALAMTLKPIIEWIVDAVYKIMAYVNYIANAWFGVNLFENAGIDDFNRDINKANKSAKELKKTLMGFDEANVMSDTSSTSGGGTLPSFDLSKINQVPIPDWVQWIADNKDLIIQLASLVGIAFGTAKVTSILTNISKLFGIAGAKGMIGGTGLAGLFSSLASIAVIAGSIAIIYLCAKKVWDDLGRLNEELGEASKKAKEIHIEWEKNLDPVEDVGTEVETINVNITDGVKELKKAYNGWSSIFGLEQGFAEVAENVADIDGQRLEKLKEMYEVDGQTLENKKKIVEALKQQWEYNLEIKGSMAVQGKDTEQIFNTTLEYLKAIKTYENDIKTIEEENAQKRKQAWISIKDKALEGLQKIKDFKIGDKETKVKISVGDALDRLKDVLSGLSMVQALKSGVSSVNQNIVQPIVSTWNSLKSVFKFATGGIVNMPGRGVPLGNVITGESGREGVIPLTDPNAMAQLGEEIGKWVNIAIDNRMVVDGRILATATNNQINKERLLMNR